MSETQQCEETAWGRQCELAVGHDGNEHINGKLKWIALVSAHAPVTEPQEPECEHCGCAPNTICHECYKVITSPPAPGERGETASKRAESGPIQFGDDWRGFFLRGDDAARLRMLIASVVGTKERPISHDQGDVLSRMQLRSFIEGLDGANHHAEAECAKLRPFSECLSVAERSAAK